MDKLSTCLWFDTQAEEAANYYVSIFDNARITGTSHYGPDMHMPEGTVLTVMVELLGREFTLLNGGPEFKFTEAVSLCLPCKDQAEIDRYWNALTADGGQPVMCGWLKDRYGLSWQVYPDKVDQWLIDPDPAKRNRFLQAMMKMVKLDYAELERAFRGD